MRRALLVLALFFSIPQAFPANPLRHSAEDQKEISAWVTSHLGAVQETYRHLHANPELSFQESKTSALVAKSLGDHGFVVTPGVGKTGVAGVLSQGSGPVVLIRGDMDALPVVEQTALPYASRVEAKRPDGIMTGVMHACGHDVHTTLIIALGQLLSDLRHCWKGTVVLIAQPAEEIGQGARAMIEAGLFDKPMVPRPDFCLSLHVTHELPAGTVGYTAGWACANADFVDITVYGKGGHGARPQDAVDPIVAAAQVITALQTLVSRRMDPREPGVVTVGSIHGGTKHNIIPDEVKLQLTVRSYTEAVRRRLLEGIRQITVDTCRAMACPREPLVVVRTADFTPATYNDPVLTESAANLFRDLIGKENVFERPPTMGAEDFGQFARHLGVPGLQYGLGSVARERWEASRKPGAEPVPPIHSPFYAPDPEPVLRTALETMGNLALALLGQ